MDWTDYGLYLNVPGNPTISTVEENGQVVQIFSGSRTDWSATAGLTQVLSRNSTFSTGLTYSYNSGFLENPYKLVMFAFCGSTGHDWRIAVDPSLQRTGKPSRPAQAMDLERALVALLSRARMARLHLDYRFSNDDWGITSHTFEATWSQPIGDSWLITPRIRYYSQEAADFYRPYFIFDEAAPTDETTGGLDFSALPVQRYSSDHRLSGFGALSGGLTVRKALFKGHQPRRRC